MTEVHVHGAHATGLFASELVCVREDVGRHNAMDKVIGWALRQGLTPLCGFARDGRVNVYTGAERVR